MFREGVPWARQLIFYRALKVVVTEMTLLDDAEQHSVSQQHS